MVGRKLSGPVERVVQPAFKTQLLENFLYIYSLL